MRTVVARLRELADVCKHRRRLGRLVVVGVRRVHGVEGVQRLGVATGTAQHVCTDTVHDWALRGHVTPLDCPGEHLSGTITTDPRLLGRTGVVACPRGREKVRGRRITQLGRFGDERRTEVLSRELGHPRTPEHVAVDDRRDGPSGAARALTDLLGAVSAPRATLYLELERPPRRAVRTEVEVGRAEGARRGEDVMDGVGAAQGAADVDGHGSRHALESRNSPRRLTLTPVDLATMRDASDDHESGCIVDGVDDSMIANPNAVVGPSSELCASDRSRVLGETVDREPYTIADGTLESAKLPRRGGNEPDLVRAGFYSRTSAHGTPSSRSSRACKAATLSSR